MIGQRAMLPEGRDRTIDDPGIARRDGRIVKAQPRGAGVDILALGNLIAPHQLQIIAD